MLKAIEKYIGDDVPVNEKVYFASTFLTSICALIYASLGVFFDVNKQTLFLFALMCATGTFLFFMGKKVSNVTPLAIIFLFTCNIVLLPEILLRQESLSSEIPIYMLAGLTFALVMLDGGLRIFQVAVQLIAIIVSCYYFFVVKNPNEILYEAKSDHEYIRIAISVIISSLLIGTIVRYKNYLLDREVALCHDAIEKAKNRNKDMDMFLINISHEIRTPINAISGNTDILKRIEHKKNALDIADGISNKCDMLIKNASELLVDYKDDDKTEFFHKGVELIDEGPLSLEGKTILAVDDNKVNLIVAKDMLKQFGASVITADCGEDAVNIVKGNNIDLVLLDYMMPGMDGVDTLKAIRNIPGESSSKLPIVAFTADTVAGARKFFFNEGFDDYLPKPIAMSRLERILRRNLQKGMTA